MLASSFGFKGTAEGLLDDRGGGFRGFQSSLLSESELSLGGSVSFLGLKTVLIISSGESELAKGSSAFP